MEVSSDPGEVVLNARPAGLARAIALLSTQGIEARRSRPRRASGLLRVDADLAERARAILRPHFSADELVEAPEAAWFRCHACGGAVSDGAIRCAACGAFIGDPHGG